MNINWEDSIEALYGTPLNARQVNVWEHYLRGMDVQPGEIIEAIEHANERKIKIKFRATAADLMEWISDLRRKKSKEGLSTHQDAETRRIMDEFKALWVPKMDEGAEWADMEQAASQKPINNTAYNQLIKEMETAGQ